MITVRRRSKTSLCAKSLHSPSLMTFDTERARADGMEEGEVSFVCFRSPHFFKAVYATLHRARGHVHMMSALGHGGGQTGRTLLHSFFIGIEGVAWEHPDWNIFFPEWNICPIYIHSILTSYKS